MINTAQLAHIIPKHRSFLKASVIVIAITFLFFFPKDTYSQRSNELMSQFEEAVRLYHFEEAEKSRELFDTIEPKICGSSDLKEQCVDVYLYQSLFYRNERDFDQTKKQLDKAYEFARSELADDHYKLIEVYVQYSYLDETQSNLDEALEWSERAVELAEKYPEKEIIVSQAYTNYGYVEDTAGEYEKAVEKYDKALEVLNGVERGFELNRALSLAHNNAGISNRKLGNFRDARDHFEQALVAAKDAYGEDHTGVAQIYNGLGTYYYSIRDLGTAIEYFKQTASTFEDAGEESSERLAIVYNNIGLIYIMIDDLKNGLIYLERAQEIKVDLFGTNHLDTAIGFHNLASHYLANEQYEEAEENYLRSLEIRKNIYGNNHPNLILPYTNIANLYIQTERYSEAEAELQKALPIGLERLGEGHPDVLTIYAQLGDVFTEQEKWKEAEDFYHKAVSILINETYKPGETEIDVDKVNYPIRFVEVGKSLGDLKMKRYRSVSDTDELNEAIRMFKYAASAIDILQTQYQSESSKLQLIDSHYSIFSSAADAYYDLYNVSKDDQWLEEMLEFMERGRSRVAVELMQNVQARNFGGVPEDILREEQNLNEKVTDHFQELNLEKEKGMDADTGLIRSFEDSLFTSRRELIQFTESLEQNFPSYYELKYDRSIAGLSDIQLMLNPDESALYYVFGDENVYSIVINRNSVHIEESGKNEEIKESIEELKQAVIARDKNAYTLNAVDLYNSLVGSIEPLIEGNSLLIFPDQSLHYLPFELLLEDSAEDMDYHELPYLVKKYPVQYASSATVLKEMQNQKPENPRNMLALAPFNESISNFDNPDADETERFFSDLTPLPLTSYETNKISELFSSRRSLIDFIFPEKVSVYQHDDATISRLEDTSVLDYSFIHIASHAFVNESNPELSGILLRDDGGKDGVLYVSDIYNIQLNADLVVLGACETGLGEVHKGEGMIGFTRAFTYAGASNLMVSMWRVNDQNTARMMIEFYRNIRENVSYRESLQKAKLKLIDNPETADPVHWAAFILNGR